jgi:hypothetical protein
MGCRVFFENHAGNVQKCKELQNLDLETLIDWEQQSASLLSPGVVTDDELLYQQIVDPTHLDPNGRKLKPTAFQDSANKGLSTHRAAHILWTDLVTRAQQRAAEYNHANPDRPQRTLWGFAPFRVEDVRKIVAAPSPTRHYFVYDTANEDDPSHADICQGVSSDRGTERSIRASLFDLAKDALIPLEAHT